MVRGQEERDPAERTGGCKSTAPPDVHDVDERTRSGTNLPRGLVRLTRRGRPLANEFDRFGWDKVTHRGIELIEEWMV
jgi:hypothetical protein